nr:uncharacterized protein LOC113807366 [Penaeus vannamei]
MTTPIWRLLPALAALWAALGVAWAGYDEYMTCGSGSERYGRQFRFHPELPCDLTKEAWCTDPGNQYPWNSVRRFVYENQGLMKRMYGNQRHYNVLRTEILNEMYDQLYDEMPKRQHHKYRRRRPRPPPRPPPRLALRQVPEGLESQRPQAGGRQGQGRAAAGQGQPPELPLDEGYRRGRGREGAAAPLEGQGHQDRRPVGAGDAFGRGSRGHLGSAGVQGRAGGGALGYHARRARHGRLGLLLLFFLFLFFFLLLYAHFRFGG